MSSSKKIEEERGNISQSWMENTNMTDFISSLYTLINTFREVPLQVSFLDDDILLWPREILAWLHSLS
jgi:hypothetical protein